MRDEASPVEAPGQEDLKVLSLAEIFEPLSKEELAEVRWEHLNTSVRAGEVFYTPMDLCETMFVLREGRVRIYRKTPAGREFTLAILESGSVFGEMTLTSQRLRNAYAEAVEPSEVAAMCRADVERLVLDKPLVGLQLVYLLSERLANYEVRLADLGLKEVPGRLASLLLQLMEWQGVRTSESYRLTTRYTHYQLATMIGANREAVTRAFGALRESGLVKVKRRYIIVEDIEGLKRVAEDPATLRAQS